MPIRIPNELPAAKTLKDENIFVMTEQRAVTQDIRPLKILLLNLMPTKIATETQLSRLLSNTPLQVELELIAPRDHVPKNTPQEHMLAFYRHFDDVRENNYDGMVITGAPVEHLPFEEVEYWEELCGIMEWSKSHVHSTFHICWGAQAGLYRHYGVNKRTLPRKLSGVYEHTIIRRRSPLFRGFDDHFWAPHSRYTEITMEQLLEKPELEILALSHEAGVFGVKSSDNRRFFVFAHPEYDDDTLAQEYFRDVKRGLDPDLPAHYFPGGNPSLSPIVNWRSSGQLLYTNWLNYYVYQTTPYDLSRITQESQS